MTIIDKFKDMGTVVMGKIESGTVREGETLLVMPNKVPVQIHIFIFSHTIYIIFGVVCRSALTLIINVLGTSQSSCYIH